MKGIIIILRSLLIISGERNITPMSDLCCYYWLVYSSACLFACLVSCLLSGFFPPFLFVFLVVRLFVIVDHGGTGRMLMKVLTPQNALIYPDHRNKHRD